MRYTKEQEVGEDVSANPSKPMLRKGVWTPEEDEKLVNYIRKNDNLGGWSYVAKQAGLLRCGKSCRLRWLNYLRPGLKHGAFSYQEEKLIIYLQSLFGNRWSLMATQLPGRTDNDVKNYWNSFIKKKLKLKHHLSCSSKSKSNTESNIPSHSTTKTVSVHGPDAFTSSHQYMVVVPERSQTPNNAFNVVTTRKNLLTLEGVLQLKNEQVQDQSDHEFSIDPNPTKNQQISYPNLWTNASSINIHESFSSPAAFISSKSPTCDQLIIESCRTTVPPIESPRFADFSLGSIGINIPCLVESDSSKEKLENDENHIMIDYSSNANDSSDVVDRGAYGSYEAGISILEKYGSLYENTTHQSCQLLDPVYQFSWPASRFSDIQSEDDWKARLNLSYNVNLGGPAYTDSSRCETYQLPFIEELVKANRIPTLLGRREESGLFETEYCKGGTGQVTAWAHDDIYNTDNADPSDLNHIYFS